MNCPRMNDIRTGVLLLALLVAPHIQPAVCHAAMIYDDFETPGAVNGIDPGLWDVIDGTWSRQSFFGSHEARSTNQGEGGTGILRSAAINVPTRGFVEFDVNGWDNVGSNVPGFYPGPAENAVFVYGGSVNGPLLAVIAPPRMDDYQHFRVDARGFDQVVVVASDTNDGASEGFAWLGIDNVEVTDAVPGNIGYVSTNDPLASDSFAGWTTTGNAFQFLSKGQNQFSTRYASEGGIYASSRAVESTIGSLTSPLLTVTSDMLYFDAAGYNGGGNGVNEFQILAGDGSTVLATLAPPGLEAGWQTLSFDLLGAGLNYGDNYYFRASDGGFNGFGWMAVDYVRVPEAGSMTLCGCASLLLGGLGFWRRRKAG